MGTGDIYAWIYSMGLQAKIYQVSALASLCLNFGKISSSAVTHEQLLPPKMQSHTNLFIPLFGIFTIVCVTVNSNNNCNSDTFPGNSSEKQLLIT